MRRLKKVKEGVQQGDCLKLLAKLPDDSVDMAFADPPFNLNKKYGAYRDKVDESDYLQWCRLWILEMVRVVKPGGAILVHNIPKWLCRYAPILEEAATFKHWIAWDAPSSVVGGTLLPSHYGILYYIKPGAPPKFYSARSPHRRCRSCHRLMKDYGGKKDLLHPFGTMLSDVWTDLHRIRHSRGRDNHPCQLPMPLLERLVLITTDEDDIVLDPFLGTGTTAIAARKLGRRYAGFELSEDFAEIAEQKLSDTESNSRIGESWVSFHLKDIVTLRNDDWEDISRFYSVPETPKGIDSKPAKLLSVKNPDLFCGCPPVAASETRAHG